jgi:hypothetical protein
MEIGINEWAQAPSRVVIHAFGFENLHFGRNLGPKFSFF